MESAKAGAVAGEGKAVTSERSSFGKSCGAPGSVEAVTPKTVAGEQTGKAHGAPKRGAQYGCMPVVSSAGNWVTWNRFFLGGRYAAPLDLFSSAGRCAIIKTLHG